MEFFCAEARDDSPLKDSHPGQYALFRALSKLNIYIIDEYCMPLLLALAILPFLPLVISPTDTIGYAGNFVMSTPDYRTMLLFSMGTHLLNPNVG